MLNEKRQIRSFGRVQSRKLKATKQNLINDLLPRLLIHIDENKKLDPKTLFKKASEIHLEIGFGYGKSLYERAKRNADIGFIGCEVYINGIAHLLKNIDESKIENIRIYDKDARTLLENLENESVDKIFVLFPDPWPKARHHKRRIINAEFLNLIHSKLKPNGTFFFASDIEQYVQWTLEHTAESGKFRATFNTLEECAREPDWWVETKYQQKAKREGRESGFLEFERV